MRIFISQKWVILKKKVLIYSLLNYTTSQENVKLKEKLSFVNKLGKNCGLTLNDFSANLNKTEIISLNILRLT